KQCRIAVCHVAMDAGACTMETGYTQCIMAQRGEFEAAVGPPPFRSPPPGPSPTRFYSGSPPSRSKEFPSRPSAEQQATDFSSVDVEDCYVHTCICRHNSVLAAACNNPFIVRHLSARYIEGKSAVRTEEKKKKRRRKGG
ncbi:unnamed protein product, partial [Heterotrigona itama]